MTIALTAPTRYLLDVRVGAETNTRPWMRRARVSVGNTATGWKADTEMENDNG